MKSCHWFSRTTHLFLALVIILTAILSTSGSAQALESTGAWVDSINFSVVNSASAVSSIKSGAIDLYSSGLQITDYLAVKQDPDLETALANGLYYELTLNPAGPEFFDGRLNPLSSPKIREALNWLIDRNYITTTILKTAAEKKFFPIVTGFPDYERYSAKVAELETEYAYNFNQAQSAIAAEMLTLGASLSGGKWYYDGAPVVLIFLIRNDSDRLRISMGDYVADQLVNVGFTVDRQYVTSSQASPLWISSDPAEGLWSIYTGAWSATAIDRDEGDNFQFFYSPNSAYGFSPLWQAYTPTIEFENVMQELAYNTFSTQIDRDTAFELALELALEDSVRVWLAHGKTYLPRSVSVTTAYDKAAGLARLWPYTVRFLDQDGGDLEIGSSALLMSPWNPVAGSTWSYDRVVIDATEDEGLLPDPTNGLMMPQRIQSAVVTAQTGLPVTKTMDWVSLNFQPTITVPPDAWMDWDATTQKFITAEEAYGVQLPTVNIKSTVIYPADLFSTVKWHDGSPLSLGDFIYAMILMYDRGKLASDIYDSSYAPWLDSYLETYRGIRIIDTDPLTIETYTNQWNLDAELNVYDWWPQGNYGPLPWHTTALAALAEADGLQAFSADKADLLSVPWTNYIGGESLGIMSGLLPVAESTNYLPYGPTLENFISLPEVQSRWDHLTTWYANRGHFWVGNGPFFLNQPNYSFGTVDLRKFELFLDPSSKWIEFNAVPTHPRLTVDFTTGAPGSTFTISGLYYPFNSQATIYINGVNLGTFMTDNQGAFTMTLATPPTAEDGLYQVTVSVNPTASLILRLDSSDPLHTTDPLPINIVSTVEDAWEFIFLPVVTR